MTSKFDEVERVANLEFALFRANEIRNSFSAPFLLPPPWTAIMYFFFYITEIFKLIRNSWNLEKSFQDAMSDFDNEEDDPDSWYCGFCYSKNSFIKKQEKDIEKVMTIWQKFGCEKAVSRMRSHWKKLPFELIPGKFVFCSSCGLPMKLCQASRKRIIQAKISTFIVFSVFILFAIIHVILHQFILLMICKRRKHDTQANHLNLGEKLQKSKSIRDVKTVIRSEKSSNSSLNPSLVSTKKSRIERYSLMT
jgi:hypothetical protein